MKAFFFITISSIAILWLLLETNRRKTTWLRRYSLVHHISKKHVCLTGLFRIVWSPWFNCQRFYIQFSFWHLATWWMHKFFLWNSKQTVATLTNIRNWIELSIYEKRSKSLVSSEKVQDNVRKVSQGPKKWYETVEYSR